MPVGNYFNLDRTGVKNAKPGYQNQVYFAPVSWFTTIQSPAAGGQGALKHTISQNHAFSTGKGFVKALTKPNQKLTKVSTGEPGALSDVYTLMAEITGDSPELQSMLEEAQNEDLIVLVKDATCEDGTVWQLGCECNPARFASNAFDSAQQGEGSKKHTLNITSPCRDVYEGTIALIS